MDQGKRIIAVIVVTAAAGGAYFLWRKPKPPPPAPPVTVPDRPAPDAAPPPDAAPDAILHPIETQGAQQLPALDQADAYLRRALGDLLGRRSLDALVFDGLVRRVVATVDNLARDSASATRWPVHPTPGEFQVEAGGDDMAVAGKNADRYAPLVGLIEGVDARRAVGLYVRLYPLFQQAYEELGYPGRYFNDRLVEVIDHLLATPEVAAPIAVKPAAPAGTPRPPGAPPLYQFQDPALEARSAGQKVLLRVGADNAARLKAKLREVRAQVVRRGPAAQR